MTLTLALMIIAYGITVAALTLLAIRVRQLIGIFKKGAADPTRSGNRGARLKNTLKETLGHTKMLNFTGTRNRALVCHDRFRRFIRNAGSSLFLNC
jgi:hypothetical protein